MSTGKADRVAGMGERVGPYEVTELLAAGGMAEILLGHKDGPGGFGKQLVIKRIAKKLLGDREIEHMFVDEARVQALLDHPNIVHVYEIGEHDGQVFLAMEYLLGETLGSLARACGFPATDSPCARGPRCCTSGSCSSRSTLSHSRGPPGTSRSSGSRPRC